ncbi:MAG: hypothetical protein LBI08_02520 [Methanomassiliicoccaceae archaeon]|jgi:hypothetical protein|nr:hypothetical protein [Methanomassiliicoccaceae archaeon]
MPQVSVYLKNDIYEKVMFKAKEEGVTVSKFIKHNDRASQRLSLYIEKDLYDKVRVEAKRREMTLSAYIRGVLIRHWQLNELSF